MEKLKQITCKEEFLRWATDVNFASEGKRNGIPDLQDVFHRGQDGDMKALKGWYLEVTQIERQLLTFSIIKAMGEETCFRFLKVWARKQANICIEEYQKDYEADCQKLADEKHAFLTEKREIEGKLEHLRKDLDGTTAELKNSRVNNDGLQATISRLQRTVEQGIQDLDAAYKEIEEASAFKAYLKGIIGSKPELTNQIR